ncbi:translationally-controlled tumor protein [Xylariaceae sp. FL0016]|nr:translationally-controlled tumor protein [Xylariaceae sp. FL0016]
MIIYKDMVAESKDELISDSFDLKEVADGIFYEADCAMIEIGAVNVDTGANASAEEAEEGTEDAAEKVNNIVHSFRLQQTSFDKKSWATTVKQYLTTLSKKQVENGVPKEEADEHLKKCINACKEIVKTFKDWEFFTGESMDVDGMIVMMNYREDGVTPYMRFWKHGLESMKV